MQLPDPFLERCVAWSSGPTRAIAVLRAAFAHYDEADIRRGLVATMDLYRWLAQETAARLGYAYPAEVDERVTGWVRMCLTDGEMDGGFGNPSVKSPAYVWGGAGALLKPDKQAQVWSPMRAMI